MSRIKVGISACLLGHNVRFNGSNCHKKWLTKTLSQYFDYQVVCPEVTAGLGVPRKTMFLVQDQAVEQPKLIMRDDNHSELSDQLKEASQKLLKMCADVSGFIVKRGSPSCGLASAKLYNDKFNVLRHNADGMFVRCLKAQFPYLPIEDEGRLNDLVIREHFIKRIYLYHAAQVMLKTVSSIAELEAFHVRHKMLLRLHNPINQRYLGRLIAQEEAKHQLDFIKQHYFLRFIQSFNKPAKPSQHYALLQRCFRTVNRCISKTDRADIQQNLQAYLDQIVPLAVPIALLRHYAQRYQQVFLQQQSYLYPYPDELALMRAV